MLSIWHVYGEQADSPMNRLLTEFNDTVGREKGILLNVTNMTNSAAIGGQLQDAKAGKPGALDYPLRLVELNALEQGSAELYKGSWYDLTNETFRASWMEFARALVQGDILISDLYSNTQVMTGETLAGLGSSAAILYYNDFVTYPDNTTEPTDLLLAPLPHAAGTATPLMPQAGVGLCAFKTTDQKAEAAAVFLLLYRGSAEVGKDRSVMPYRKWRMEFQTDQFPDYDRWMTPDSAPLYQSYTLTERFELPGTSEEVQLFLLPLRGRDGTMYGLCGFEISESYFKQNFAQPTGSDRLSCLLAPAGDGLAADAALSSGTTGGYYHAPRNTLVLRSMGGGLTQLTGPDSAYAGIPTLT